MFAVIFRATINQIDSAYSETAERMRKLAIDKYGCSEFTAVTAGNEEIAISYWKEEEQIRAWKADGEHLVAQRLGREKWYKAYKIEVVRVLREYSST